MNNHKLTLHRVAAIDLGSNSFQCLIVELEQSVTVLAEYREPVRLKAGVDSNLGVRRVTSERALQVLSFFKDRLEAHQVQMVNVVGTQAFRELPKESLFLKKAESILGHSIRIIGGLEEGFAIYRAILDPRLASSHAHGHKHLIIDIGGGSTECVAGEQATPLHGLSLPIGSVALKQLCPLSELTTKTIQTLKDYCWHATSPLIESFEGIQWDSCAIASGVAQILAELADYKGYPSLSFKLIEDLLTELGSLQKVPEWPLPSLTSDRRYIVVESLTILWAIMKRLSISEVLPSSRALRHGLLLELMSQERMMPAVMSL